MLFGASFEPVLSEGQRAFDSGDMAGALQAWTVGLRDAREAEDRAAELDFLLRLGAIHRRLGRVEVAERVLKAAKALVQTDAEKARLSLDTGSLHLATGDLKRAEAEFRTAFLTYQGANLPSGAGISALNLAVVRRVLSDPQGASKALTAADTLFSALNDQGSMVGVILERARLAQQGAKLSDALQHCEDAVGLALLSSEPELLTEAQLLRGALLRSLGRPAEARTSLLAGLKLAKSRKDVIAQARFHTALAGLALGTREGDALGHLRSAEAGFLAGGDRRGALEVAVNLAVIDGRAGALRSLVKRSDEVGDDRLVATVALNLAALGDPEMLKKAGKIVQRLGLSDLLWRYEFLAGRAALDAGKSKKGVELLQSAVQELERRRRSLERRDSQANRAFVVQHTAVYQALVDALLAEGDSTGAFMYAQRLQLHDLTPASQPELDGLADEEAFLTDELESAVDPEQQAALAAKLASLRVRFASAVDGLRSSYTDFDRAARMDPEDLEAIQAGLPEGVTVLQPLLFEDRLVLLVFRRDLLKAVQLPVDGAVVRKTISRLSRSLQAAHTRDLAWTQAQLDTLGGWFITPIADLLKGSDVLVMSTTGVLREVPFGLVRTEGRYLIEDHAVVSVTHVGSLAERNPSFRLKQEEVLLVGNPDGSLPGAEREVHDIASLLPGSDVLIGEQGSREAFLTEAAGKSVVHLATHGVIDREDPSSSYLVLSDDHLSYQEIPGLAGPLSNCRLVVLSACQSGLAVHAESPTDEGIVVSINGLAAQFRRAGVETLLASLWRVDDKATLSLMSGLYEELGSGVDIAQSLRRAQLRMLAQESTAHPWYWGAFVVVGDWR